MGQWGAWGSDAAGKACSPHTAEPVHLQHRARYEAHPSRRSGAGRPNPGGSTGPASRSLRGATTAAGGASPLRALLLGLRLSISLRSRTPSSGGEGLRRLRFHSRWLQWEQGVAGRGEGGVRWVPAQLSREVCRSQAGRRRGQARQTLQSAKTKHHHHTAIPTAPSACPPAVRCSLLLFRCSRRLRFLGGCCRRRSCCRSGRGHSRRRWGRHRGLWPILLHTFQAEVGVAGAVANGCVRKGWAGQVERCSCRSVQTRRPPGRRSSFGSSTSPPSEDPLCRPPGASLQ